MAQGQNVEKAANPAEAKAKQRRVPLPANCVPVCPPSKDMLTPGRFTVNDMNMMEAITQPLYSYQTYPAAGTSTLSFFVNPASGVVTREDTNMELAGQIPAPQKFLIQGIGVDYISALAPVELGADNVTSQLNDMKAILSRGLFTLTIGSKPYLEISTLKMLPMRSYVRGDVAVASATTPAAALQTLITQAWVDGEVYKPTPLLLEAGQNFRVTISFPGGVVPVPSTSATDRIGVVLYGTLYRPPQ